MSVLKCILLTYLAEYSHKPGCTLSLQVHLCSCLSLSPEKAFPTWNIPTLPHEEIHSMGPRRHLRSNAAFPIREWDSIILLIQFNSSQVSLERVSLSRHLLECFFSFFLSFNKYQYKEGKKLKPKPNYNSVDLSEVEWEDQDEIVSIGKWIQAFCSSLLHNLAYLYRMRRKEEALLFLLCVTGPVRSWWEENKVSAPYRVLAFLLCMSFCPHGTERGKYWQEEGRSWGMLWGISLCVRGPCAGGSCCTSGFSLIQSQKSLGVWRCPMRLLVHAVCEI